ncbi:DUF6053 domain-containing protein [Lysobacter gummosus]
MVKFQAIGAKSIGAEAPPTKDLVDSRFRHSA